MQLLLLKFFFSLYQYVVKLLCDELSVRFQMEKVRHQLWTLLQVNHNKLVFVIVSGCNVRVLASESFWHSLLIERSTLECRLFYSTLLFIVVIVKGSGEL